MPHREKQKFEQQLNLDADNKQRLLEASNNLMSYKEELVRTIEGNFRQ